MSINQKRILGGIVGGLLGYGVRLLLILYVVPQAHRFYYFSVVGLALTLLGFMAGYSLMGLRRRHSRG